MLTSTEGTEGTEENPMSLLPLRVLRPLCERQMYKLAYNGITDRISSAEQVPPKMLSPSLSVSSVPPWFAFP